MHIYTMNILAYSNTMPAEDNTIVTVELSDP